MNDLAHSSGHVLRWWPMWRALLASALVVGLLIPFILTKDRLFEPMGEVRGWLGPLEDNHEGREAAQAVTIETEAGELLLVYLRPGGQIASFLQTANRSQPVTVYYQGQTAVRVKTATVEISEYPPRYRLITGVLGMLVVGGLILLMFPVTVERLFVNESQPSIHG